MGYEFSVTDLDIIRTRFYHTLANENTRHQLPSLTDEDVKYRLRLWDAAKSQYLLKLMDGELDLVRPVKMERTFNDLQTDINQLVRGWRDFQTNFYEKLSAALGLTLHYMSEQDDERDFYNSCHRLFDNYALYEGVVNFATPLVRINGKPIQICSGAKTMRTLGKICKMLDMTAEFEQFRIAHSQIMNQRCLSGELHLSIHPLDYMTASDNTCGWSSCMSWDEEGSYRMGTIEMMNSPMVICAYLNSRHSKYEIGPYEWNSKKWRAWVIITKDVIVVNRNFPYENSELNRACLDWVRELAQENLGWGYEQHVKIIDDAHSKFSFETNLMYNDMSCEYEMYEGKDSASGDGGYIDINFSGPAMCINCGDIVCDDDEVSAGTLLCENCGVATRCACCGDRLSEDYTFWGLDDEPYCESCYNDRFTHVECCDTDCYSDNVVDVSIPFKDHDVIDLILDNPEFAELRDTILTDWHWSGVSVYRGYYVRRDYFGCLICEDCIDAYDIELDNFTYSKSCRLTNDGWNSVGGQVLRDARDLYPVLRAMGLIWRRNDEETLLYDKFYRQILTMAEEIYE